MTDNITITGVVGTDPHHHVTGQGLPITSFRLASTRRYFDRAKGSWEDGETNWYTVSAFRQLASNASQSIRKGERVVVCGRLRLRAWETGEKSGTAVEIEADAIGHDLAWGVTSYTKVRSARPADASGEVAEHDDASPAETGSGSGWPHTEAIEVAPSSEEFEPAVAAV
jgi:single-strand DNA-binding protein